VGSRNYLKGKKMAFQPFFEKEVLNIDATVESATIETARNAVEAIEGFDDIPALTQHVLGIIEVFDTLSDDLKAAAVAADKDTIDAGIDATGLEDSVKEYLKGRVALDFA